MRYHSKIWHHSSQSTTVTQHITKENETAQYEIHFGFIQHYCFHFRLGSSFWEIRYVLETTITEYVSIDGLTFFIDCSLPKDVGPCRKADLTYYYDTESKSCQSFFYGGCHGNNNRFDTQEACEKACL